MTINVIPKVKTTIFQYQPSISSSRSLNGPSVSLSLIIAEILVLVLVLALVLVLRISNVFARLDGGVLFEC